MIENKYRFLICLVRYSRDRGLPFLSSQTGINAQKRGRAKLQIKIRWCGALIWSVKNYFQTGTQQGALRVVPRLCVLPISRAAYCCSDFVMSAWSAWDKLKLLALQSFFNLLSRSCHMLIRLIKITKCQCYWWGGVAASWAVRVGLSEVTNIAEQLTMGLPEIVCVLIFSLFRLLAMRYFQAQTEN